MTLWKWYHYIPELTIEVQNYYYDKIEDFRTYIAKEGLVTGGTVQKYVNRFLWGTACNGLIDTFGLSEEILKCSLTDIPM